MIWNAMVSTEWSPEVTKTQTKAQSDQNKTTQN